MIEVRLRGQLPSAIVAYDQAQALGRLVCERHQLAQVEIVVNNNRSRVLSWRLGAAARISVHWALLPWPEQVLASMDRKPGAWEALRKRLPVPSTPPTTPEGEVHDLSELLREQRYHAADAPDMQITWGQWPRRPPRRSIRLGSCSPHLIRIHPVLDDARVPRWFVGFVVFHELLHAVLPPRVENGRRKIHTPEFRRAEARHPDFGRAQRWEHDNVAILIRRVQERARS